MKNKIINSLQILNDAKWTSMARPTIIYAGLMFILIEITGLRWFIFQYLDACKEIIDYSDFIMKNFIIFWGIPVGVYSIVRTAEKNTLMVNFTNVSTQKIKKESHYTKRARPSVIYFGMCYIFCEIIGVRWLIFKVFDFNIGQENKDILIKSTKDIFQCFFMIWALLVSEYIGCRCSEKISKKNVNNASDDENNNNIAMA